MGRPTKAIINLSHLRHNYALAKTYAGSAQLMAVVKANGYGHGAVRIAQALSIPNASTNNSADAFAVASIEEALELREAGIEQRIVLLEGFFHPSELDTIVREQLDIVVHSAQQVEQLLAASLAAGPGQESINVWLKADTGMQRLGLIPDTVSTAFQQLTGSSNVNELRLMTHFACADIPEHSANQQQLAVFSELHRRGTETSLANSAALVALPSAIGGKAAAKNIIGDWARPGIMLYGANPMAVEHPVSRDLLPVMTLTSQIISTRILKPGESTGYGKDWIAGKPMRVGIVAIGYADGYPRHAPTGTPVLIAGKPSRLLGRVSMDMIAVDLSELPEYGEGDSVTLWGEGLPVWEVARHAGTISYELLTGVTQRVRVEVVDG